MKKLIAIVSSLLFVTMISASANNLGFGITGAAHYIMADGTETTRQSNQVNEGSHEELVAIPEVFLETFNDDGFTLGISYIPTRDMGSESRTDTASATGRDGGTYKAEAELEDVISVYADIPTGGSLFGYPIHGKVGVQRVTLATLESLNSGETYPNADLYGFTIGIGSKGDLPYGNNLYYKGEITYTDFEPYAGSGTAGNKVKANIEDLAAKFSVGYRF